MSSNNGVERRTIFEFGDHVRHGGCPEWGTGVVTRVENVPVKGKPTQRLSIRFSNAGLKTLNADVADLEQVQPEAVVEEAPVDRIAGIDRIAEDELLAPLATRKLMEVMLAIPEPCRDPFTTLESRIKSTVGLYRFDGGGRGLVDWAVAQTGLSDPLSRFNRHELEEHFSRWTGEREAHLQKLLREAREAGLNVEGLLADAPAPVAAAARRAR
ncbi:MAG: DUF3553 domain-containing protein [Phycisphaerales bacterium]|nr:DUF3553 domain-containing protein [Phycisphaerales bacterium]